MNTEKTLWESLPARPGVSPAAIVLGLLALAGGWTAYYTIPAESEGVLGPQEKRLAFDALFWPGAPPSLEQAQGYLRKLKIERLERKRDELKRDIDAAVQSQDSERLRELQGRKLTLDKELRNIGSAIKKPS